MVLWWPTRPSRTNTQKRCPFHYKGLECKSRKSRDTWNNRQVWRWSTKWSRSKANRVLPREHTCHSKHPLPTTQETTLHMDISRYKYQNQIDYILCSWRWRSSIKSAKIRPGADCGPDHELLIAKFRLKLKKVGKTTRPFRYQFSSVQSLSRVRLCATPWIAAHQASLSITNSWSSPKLTSIESVMPSSHLILCRPLLLLPSIHPSIKVFSNETTLHMDISRYKYQNQIDYILCSWRWRSSIQSAKTRPGPDCGSNHELLITKFRLKLKKVRQITRPLRYDLLSSI